MDIKTTEQALKLQTELAGRLQQTVELPQKGKPPTLDALVKEKEQLIVRARADVDGAAKERDEAVRRWDERLAQRRLKLTQLEQEMTDLQQRVANQKRKPRKGNDQCAMRLNSTVKTAAARVHPCRLQATTGTQRTPMRSRHPLLPIHSPRAVVIMQQRGGGVHRQRLAEQITLRRYAVSADEIQLLAGFHPFGDDVQLQRLGHRDDGCDDGGVVGIGGDVADERAIDLESIDGETFQITQ